MAKKSDVKKKAAKSAKATKKDVKSKTSEKKLKRGSKVAEKGKKSVKEEPKQKTKSKKAAEKVVAKVDTKKKGKSAKSEDDAAEAPAVHAKSRTDKSKMPSILQSKAYLELVKQMDGIEKKLNITRTDLFVGEHIVNAISTGVLALDFTMGGGYAGGRFHVMPGKEGSGKSTAVMTSIANATAQNVPSIVIDAESAFDASYADRAMSRFGYTMRSMQGSYDSKKGIWIVPPMVRIEQINNLEQSFRFLRRTMKCMPEIRRDHDNNFWAVEQILNKDGSVKKETAVEHDGSVQMMFYIDSLAALIPNILDSDDEKATIGAQALGFSKMLPAVCSLITSRNCILVGTNQLRDTIGGYSMPGRPAPQTQPGGNALKFYTDSRNFINSCAPTTAGWSKSDTESTEEPSIEGGTDKYVFTKFKNNKNKVYSPKREGYARIRFMHNSRPGDGYCESFDVFTFLQSTGQASRRGTTLSLDIQPVKEKGKLPALPLDTQAKKVGWMDFKRAVESKEFKHQMFNHCRAQIKSGYAFDLERIRVTDRKQSTFDTGDSEG